MPLTFAALAGCGDDSGDGGSQDLVVAEVAGGRIEDIIRCTDHVAGGYVQTCESLAEAASS